MACLTAVWWGCGSSPASTTSSSSSSTSSGSGGSGGMVDIDGGQGGGGEEEAGACTSTSAEAHHIRVDIIFLIDQSGSMTGPKWIGTKNALTTFWNDPASVGIGAGLTFLPNKKPDVCVPTDYEALNVPIDTLPANAFALTNALPYDATGVGTPLYGALKGTLMAATAYQDAHPTHKVIVVLATDGDPNYCGMTTIDDVAAQAKSARSYNGVLTYVIGVQGSTLSNLDKIAAAGGTGKAYDVTNDINQFASKIAEIREVTIGCKFEIPPPPMNMQLDPNKVNFTYTPMGTGSPKLLPRATDLADCSGGPGWYYDNNDTPTTIILCPASCSTVQADPAAKVDVLFGCKSIIK
jgi:uncharacterized protein YegL